MQLLTALLGAIDTSEDHHLLDTVWNVDNLILYEKTYIRNILSDVSETKQSDVWSNEIAMMEFVWTGILLRPTMH